jgi:mannitol 2-dehydrogenase
MTAGPDGKISARIIGSIIETIFAPENSEAAIEKMAHPDTKIISLTITEGGYNIDSASGKFNIANPAVQKDLRNPEKPGTVFGYLTQSLKRRMERSSPGVTIQSCDNIQKNGDVLRNMLSSYIAEAEPGLTGWLEKYVTFPNSMVDRITPATSTSDIEKLRTSLGIEDAWPVVCEPYKQWVIEDKYSSGRPEWESFGAQFVPDVSPYEKMKIRLLNAGHSLLGFLGALRGYKYIHESVHDPLLLSFLRSFWNEEVIPVLDEVPGIDLDLYKSSLVERFGNSYIKDEVSRICLQSSSKIPKFLLPTIREQLAAGGPVEISAFVVAAWCRYSEGTDESGNRYILMDDMSEVLQERALNSRKDPLAFLKIESIFGSLANSGKFTESYINALHSIYRAGVTEYIKIRTFK